MAQKRSSKSKRRKVKKTEHSPEVLELVRAMARRDALADYEAERARIRRELLAKQLRQEWPIKPD